MSIGFRRLEKILDWSRKMSDPMVRSTPTCKAAKKADCGLGHFLKLREIDNQVQFSRKAIHRLVEVRIGGLRGKRRLVGWWIWAR